jgi:hypothetical protein
LAVELPLLGKCFATVPRLMRAGELNLQPAPQ